MAEHVEAGRALGATGSGIVLRHILPNILSPVIVETSLALSRAIYTETALSFLGLGPPPTNPTWGSMLAQSRQFMEFAPWTALAPGLAIALATMTFILLGNGLRERTIAGAAIDVWDRYPAGDGPCLPSTEPFHELDNVIITPHVAGWTDGTARHRWAAIADNLRRLEAGEPLLNVVRHAS